MNFQPSTHWNLGLPGSDAEKSSTLFTNFNHYYYCFIDFSRQNTAYVLNITFIIDKFRRSSGAVTPALYERNSKMKAIQ